MFVAPERRHLALVRWVAFGLVWAMAFPWSTFAWAGIVDATLWALFSALAMTFALAQRLPLTMTVMAGFVLAYSQGQGDSLVDGVTIEGASARAESVVSAIVGVGVFLA